MRRLAPVFVLAASLSLPGCVAKTAFDVVTAPVRAAGKAVDLATTSQSEADEKRGREIRKREEELGKLYRKREKLAEECDEGERDSCRDLAEIDDALQEIGEPTRR